jgi:TetR/AcrR family fatty acid metabolism transcriptional regulator
VVDTEASDATNKKAEAEASAERTTEGKETDPSRSAKQRRLDKLREVQRTAILNAAQEIFAAKGYYEAKMTDIAKQAGFSTGSLYNYFTGKDEIFATLLSDQLEGLWGRLDAQFAQPGDFMSLIERITSVYARYMDEHRELFQIVHHTFPAVVWGPASSEIPEGMEATLGAKGDLYTRFIELTTRLLRRGMEEGVLRELDPRALAVMLIGTMDSVNQLWLQEEPHRPFAETMPFVLDVFLNGVLK